MQKFKQSTLNDILEVLYHDNEHDTTKNINMHDYGLESIRKSVEIYEPLTYDQILKANKKKYRDLKINYLIYKFENTLKNLKEIIEEYKKLKNKTEYWENKSTYDFNFEDWNTIKKANGKITRYYNELKDIRNKIMNEKITNLHFLTKEEK